MSTAKRTILLIDDDVSLLLTLGDFLKFKGYHVETADSGEAGLAQLHTLRPDLIILDMSMPGMGGLGFLKAISSSDGKPRHPVLVLTARANMAESFGRIEVDGFVTKPCVPGDLLAEVGRILFLRGTTAAPVDAARPVRVLVGESDDALRERILEALRGAGYVAEGAARGPEVLERAIVERPDVALVNLVFGSMNGDAVAAMLGAMPKTGGLPVVLYDGSGAAVPGDRYARPEAHVVRFVRSAAPEMLVAAVSAVLGAAPKGG